jgi:hypothetical protein
LIARDELFRLAQMIEDDASRADVGNKDSESGPVETV